MSSPNQNPAKGITIEEVQTLLQGVTGKPADPKALAAILDRVRHRLELEAWLYARDNANVEIRAIARAAKAAREAQAAAKAN